jgi:hypothetical protein
MTAVWLFLRAEARRRWRAWLSLALMSVFLPAWW